MKVDAEIFALATVISPASQKLSGAALENTLVAVWKAKPSESYSKLSQNLMQRTGRPIAQDAFAVPPYDAARLVLRALAAPTAVSSDGLVDTKKVLSELYNKVPLSGPSGEISILADGTATGFSNMGLFRVHGKGLEPVRESH